MIRWSLPSSATRHPLVRVLLVALGGALTLLAALFSLALFVVLAVGAGIWLAVARGRRKPIAQPPPGAATAVIEGSFRVVEKPPPPR